MPGNQELAIVFKLIADQFQSELKKSRGLLGDFSRDLLGWKTGLTAVATGLFAIAKSTASYGEELLNTSEKVDVSVQALAGLQYAAKLANVENQSLVSGLKIFSQNIAEAASGTGDGADVMRRLGVDVRDAGGKVKSTEALFFDAADALSHMGKSAARTDLFVKAFGKSGLELAPMLADGSAGLREMYQEAERLGLIMSREDVLAAGRFNDSIDRLTGSLGGLKNSIGNELIPGLDMVANALTTGSIKFREFTESVRESRKENGLWWQMLDKLVKNLTSLPDLPPFLVEALGGNVPTVDATKYGAPIGPKRPREAPLAEDKGKKGKVASALESELRAQREGLHALLAERKLALEDEASLVDEALAHRTIGEQDALAAKRQLDAKARDAERASLGAELRALSDYYRKRKQVGFENADEQRKFEADYSKQTVELVRKEQEAITKFRIGDRKSALDAEKLLGEQQERLGKQIVEETLLDIQIRESAEEAKGRRIVESTKSQFEIERTLRQRDQDEYIAYWQAVIEGGEAELRSREQQAEAREELLKAQLAKELDLQLRQIDELVDAWKRGDQAVANTILAGAPLKSTREKEALKERFAPKIAREQRMQESPALEGLAEGFRQFTDSNGIFNLGVEMARQTAQSMKSSFDNLFFDAMNGKINTLRGAWDSLFTFMQRTASNVLSTIATNYLTGQMANALGSAGGAGGGGFGSFFDMFKGAGFGAAQMGNPTQYASAIGPGLGGMARGGWVKPRYFAGGGSVFSNGDSVPAMLTPGEFVVSRSGVAALERLNQGQTGRPAAASKPINVTMNIATPNVDSFQASKTQVLASLQVALAHARRNL